MIWTIDKIRQLTGILGHMLKAQNDIKENLNLIDIVVEILDARLPKSSSNPLIYELAKNKEKIIVLNKSDLADDKKTNKWINYFNQKGIECVKTNANLSENINKIVEKINKIGENIYNKKYENKKVTIKPIYRVLIVGIPNVGKSTIINKIAKREVANVGNKPGITKTKQWIRVGSNIELLDTPGLLWPKFDDEQIGINLALTGNIKQEVLDIEELAILGIEKLKENKEYASLLISKYKLNNEDLKNSSYEILKLIGKKRGCIRAGGNIDTQRAANLFLEDFKNGKIGKITLDDIDLNC